MNHATTVDSLIELDLNPWAAKVLIAILYCVTNTNHHFWL